MTANKFNWNTAPTVNFKDLKIDEMFMTIGNEVYIKSGESEALRVNDSYDTDTYRMDDYTKCKSRGFKK
jgi:hypothetical protein